MYDLDNARLSFVEDRVIDDNNLIERAKSTGELDIEMSCRIISSCSELNAPREPTADGTKHAASSCIGTKSLPPFDAANVSVDSAVHRVLIDSMTFDCGTSGVELFL